MGGPVHAWREGKSSLAQEVMLLLRLLRRFRIVIDSMCLDQQGLLQIHVLPLVGVGFCTGSSQGQQALAAQLGLCLAGPVQAPRRLWFSGLA